MSRHAPMALRITDAQQRAHADQIQQDHQMWLVMWSTWHRTFTAFGCFAPRQLMVDEPTAQKLIARMRRAEMYYRNPQ